MLSGDRADSAKIRLCFLVDLIIIMRITSFTRGGSFLLRVFIDVTGKPVDNANGFMAKLTFSNLRKVNRLPSMPWMSLLFGMNIRI
jgi:hypothetical protein